MLACPAMATSPPFAGIPTAVHRGKNARLPYVFVDERVELKVLQVKIREGLWVIQNRFHPGAKVQTHKHTGTVFAFTTSGSWKYAEYDDVNTAGSYLYEPAGSVHTLIVPETNTEPTEVWFAITGANLNLDADGKVEQVIDAALVLEFYRAMCESAGLGQPDVIVD
jgi:2,4'-dihydroxyacetophenone dioxygenase